VQPRLSGCYAVFTVWTHCDERLTASFCRCFIGQTDDNATVLLDGASSLIISPACRPTTAQVDLLYSKLLLLLLLHKQETTIIAFVAISVFQLSTRVGLVARL